MKRILVHIPVTPYGEYDIFAKHDTEAFVASVKTINAGSCPNMGNRLLFQGIVSAIECEDNSLEFWSPLMSKDYINDNYDLIVAPMANVFAASFINLLETLAENATEEMITSGFDLSLYTCTTGGGSRVTVRCNTVKK